ncbi:MAG: Na+/H+ antiporter subunit E [Eubacteriaceae bacterium]|nr:Na+/H+ antiporter subunit E [Eubacteriaceae bacterium]
MFSIVISGKFTVEIGLVFGGVSIVVFLFCKKYLGYSIKKEKIILRNTFIAIEYLWCVFKNLILSNISVIKLIYAKKNLTHPYLVSFSSGISSDFLNMILANSISLTPGTITVDQSGQKFIIHCIEKSLADGIENSDFIRILRKMEVE